MWVQRLPHPALVNAPFYTPRSPENGSRPRRPPATSGPPTVARPGAVAAIILPPGDGGRPPAGCGGSCSFHRTPARLACLALPRSDVGGDAPADPSPTHVFRAGWRRRRHGHARAAAECLRRPHGATPMSCSCGGSRRGGVVGGRRWSPTSWRRRVGAGPGGGAVRPAPRPTRPGRRRRVRDARALTWVASGVRSAVMARHEGWPASVMMMHWGYLWRWRTRPERRRRSGAGRPAGPATEVVESRFKESCVWSSLDEAAPTERDSVRAPVIEQTPNRRDSVPSLIGCLALDRELVRETGGSARTHELDGNNLRLRWQRLSAMQWNEVPQSP